MRVLLMFLCRTTCLGCLTDSSGCCTCPPGSIKADGGDCDDPRCVFCHLYEYMDVYNRLTSCMSQPYYDANKNFMPGNFYSIFFLDGRPSITRVQDGNNSVLYDTRSPYNLPLCSQLHYFVTYCVPCWTSGGGTAVVCQKGVRPTFVNGQRMWSNTYKPKYIVYNPQEQLTCVCKPGFHCSTDECMTCIEGEQPVATEATKAPLLLSEDSGSRTLTQGIISGVCVMLALLLIFGLAFRTCSALRLVWVHTGQECRAGLTAANDCIIRLLRRLSRPATAPAGIPDVSHADNVVLDKPNCTALPNDYNQVRRIGERRIAGVRLNIVLYAVIAVTLSSTLIVGTLYIADRLLINHCDSTISMYTFPLGYTVTSKGLGNLEAVVLSGFLDRCRKQNEFLVPARVKFHKAIRCLRGSREYKRASGHVPQTKQSDGTKDSSSGHVGALGSFGGVTASAKVTFSKMDAVERSMERTVALTDKVSVSSS